MRGARRAGARRAGARDRLITGDYLGLTSADILRTLLALSQEHAAMIPVIRSVPATQT